VSDAKRCDQCREFATLFHQWLTATHGGTTRDICSYECLEAWAMHQREREQQQEQELKDALARRPT
jgi:hypothetical protein